MNVLTLATSQIEVLLLKSIFLSVVSLTNVISVTLLKTIFFYLSE